MIIGACSCPVGQNCKHVAALLLQALAEPAPAVNPLSERVMQWLSQIKRAQKPATTDKPGRPTRALIYLLDTATDSAGMPRLRLSFVSRAVRQDGSFSGEIRNFQLGSWPGRHVPKYLDRADLSIIQRLGSAAAHDFSAGRGDGWILHGEFGAELLRRVLATGRCRWDSADGALLSESASRNGQLNWKLESDGFQRAQLTARDAEYVGVLDPPWYVDATAGLCGPVDPGAPADMVALFLAAPPLSPTEAAVVRAHLIDSTPPGAEFSAVLPPSELPPPWRIACKPIPRLSLALRLFEPVGWWPAMGARSANVDGVTVAALSFLYESFEFATDDTRTNPVLSVDGALVEVARDLKDERAAAERLKRYGFRSLRELYHWRTQADFRNYLSLSGPVSGDDEERWFDFLAHYVPELIASGWQVDVAADFPYQLARTDGDIEAALEPGSGIDWFELHLGVHVDGTRIDILPPLLDMLRRIPSDNLAEFLQTEHEASALVRVRLEDGRILALERSRLLPILQALAAMYSAERGDRRVILRRSDAAEVAEMEDRSGLVWRGGEALRLLGHRLKAGRGAAPVAIPPSFAGTLRPYQQAGVEWLQLLRELELGGVLADDMGLGKTVQVLAYIAVEKACGRLNRPCLVVAPTSLMPNWRAEAAAFTPGLSVLLLHGADRQQSFDALAAHDLVLTTYPLLPRDTEVLSGQSWHAVIADEAQFIKNPATAAARAIRRLDARHRLALTGTPLENHLGEFWALFDFVSPGLLGDSRSFSREWRLPIEKHGDQFRQKRLAQRVRPFLLRRSKSEVAADLPPKTDIVVPIALGQTQRDLYEGIRLAVHRKVREAIANKGLKRSHIEFLDALLKLRQTCCDPRLVKSAPQKAAKPGSAKLERLLEMLPELIDEGRHILLFSQFTSMLDLIQPELIRANIPFVLLTGETRDRATPVASFQRGDVPVFLISLKAGGVGLNLTAADTVIHYDPWWNPAVEAQATDRAHRIGQDKPVFVHKLVALDTIEIKMSELKARKQALADGLFDPNIKSALDISADDVEFLLGDAA